MRKIFIGLIIGIFLNVGYFGWEFQEYIYYFFEPCQQCNNKEIRDCEWCNDGFQIEYNKNCIDGKIAVVCDSCPEIKCNDCNGIKGSLENFCFSCNGKGFTKNKIAGDIDCPQKKEPCLYCDAKGETICTGCIKGCFHCRGTGKKDCFQCIGGKLKDGNDDIPCFFCDAKGHEICDKCNGTGDH